jgi:hypothetical protein
MPDIFVSDAREDRVRAQAFAQALEVLGWPVWWDDHTRAGAEFDQVVDQQLDSALCVVVLDQNELPYDPRPRRTGCTTESRAGRATGSQTR